MYYIGTLFVILILLCVVIVIRDSNRFVIQYYQIKNQKIKGHHRYVFLSDLHNKQFGRNHGRLIKEIDRIQPEIVLLGGDILTAKPGEDFGSAVSLVRQLSEKYPVYYANGNHEYRIRIYPETYGDMVERYEQAIGETNAIRLVDESIYIQDANIKISGLDIVRKYYKRFHKKEMKPGYLRKRLGDKEADVFQILLAHNPEYFEAYAAYGVELVLAGHVHGGIANLPFIGGVISPSLRLFPKYDGGFFAEGRTSMVLSRGLGTHTIPVRFMNPGELVVLCLHGK